MLRRWEVGVVGWGWAGEWWEWKVGGRGTRRRGKEDRYNQDIKQIWRRRGDEDEDKGMLLCCSVTELKYKVP